MFFSDYHIHTDFSSDSQAPIKEVIKKAINLGLKEIAITDHIDYGFPSSEYTFLFDKLEYIETINNLRKKYNNFINILIGAEIGMTPDSYEYNKNFVKDSCFDFIIGSIHVVDNIDVYENSFFEGRSQKQSYMRYFEYALENIKKNDYFDVVGHLDYIYRYGQFENKSLKYVDYKDIIDEILKIIIEKGKGIEVNTSGYKYKLNNIHPQIDILKQYKNLGGEIITIGSDAHSTNYISDHFLEAYNSIKIAGFKYFTRFKNRKPYFYDLDKFMN